MNTENNPLLTPFIFKYCERTACSFDTSLSPRITSFLIRRDAINIFKTRAGGSPLAKRREKETKYIFFV